MAAHGVTVTCIPIEDDGGGLGEISGAVEADNELLHFSAPSFEVVYACMGSSVFLVSY